MAAKQKFTLNMYRSSLFTFISQHISLERWGLCLWRVKVKGSYLLLCWLWGYAWEEWLILVLNVQNLHFPWQRGKQEDHNGVPHPRDAYGESLEGWRDTAQPLCDLETLSLEDVCSHVRFHGINWRPQLLCLLCIWMPTTPLPVLARNTHRYTYPCCFFPRPYMWKLEIIWKTEDFYCQKFSLRMNT